jgi:SAM-dependent methyltransferase
MPTTSNESANTRPPRGTFRFKVQKALSKPSRILPHFKRTLHNAFINLTSRDAIEAHRRFIEEYAKENPIYAMGSDTQEHWLSFGKAQFEFLTAHGVLPTHHVLEPGCGNLRLGWHLINYLEAGHYVGLEISPVILTLARSRIHESGLQAKRPYLFLVDDIDYGFLPNGFYDCINAHAVFTQAQFTAIDRTVIALAPLLKPGGFFDFTYYETEGNPYSFQNVHYYYRREQIATILAKTGLQAEWLPAFDRDQVKVRLRRLLT